MSYYVVIGACYVELRRLSSIVGACYVELRRLSSIVGACYVELRRLSSMTDDVVQRSMLQQWSMLR